MFTKNTIFEIQTGKVRKDDTKYHLYYYDIIIFVKIVIFIYNIFLSPCPTWNTKRRKMSRFITASNNRMHAW